MAASPRGNILLRATQVEQFFKDTAIAHRAFPLAGHAWGITAASSRSRVFGDLPNEEQQAPDKQVGAVWSDHLIDVLSLAIEGRIAQRSSTTRRDETVAPDCARTK